VVQFEEGRADDVVQAGAQAAARDKGCTCPARFEEQLLPRPGFLEKGLVIHRDARGDFDLVTHAGFLRHEIADAVPTDGVQIQRGWKSAGAEGLNGSVNTGGHGRPPEGLRAAGNQPQPVGDGLGGMRRKGQVKVQGAGGHRAGDG